MQFLHIIGFLVDNSTRGIWSDYGAWGTCVPEPYLDQCFGMEFRYRICTEIGQGGDECSDDQVDTDRRQCHLNSGIFHFSLS